LSAAAATGTGPQTRPLLALDAAGQACSAALWQPGRGLLARRFERRARGQSERLLPLVEAVMAEAGVGYAALGAIAVTLGPGGFTGVRIGLAAAEGLALAWDLPILGLDSFAVVAAAVPPAEREGRDLLVLIEAKRAEVYAQLRPAGEAPGVPALLLPAALAAGLPRRPLLLAGDAVAQARPALAAAGLELRDSSAAGEADAAVLARLAAALPLPADRRPPRPLYLRAPDTTLPRRGAPRP
jgi:tRNA threonylcarbamoyladenosine biosynthesis protein TsaB